MADNKLDAGFIETLKSKNDIVSIIGDRIRLEQKGKNFWACCPFHHEKTPSFCINEYQGFYHCFGCNESGDVISFLRKYENWTYMETIKYLADKAGMKIPENCLNENYNKIKKERDISLQILNLAKDIYKENIYERDATLAQQYLKKRKVGKKELENFELGFSKDGFQIVDKLKAKGYSDIELKNSGLCELSKNGKAYDFYNGRLIFPIINSYGDCVGFSGRDLTGQTHAKYKNSPATSIFDKSKTVYGINLLKNLKQTEIIPYIILVEGQFDVITMHHYGFTNTVACLGTAITKEHIRELKRFSTNIILCLDGDSAGQKATLRSLPIFDGTGINLKVCILPDSIDPDEYLAKFGADNLKNLLDNSVSPMEFKIILAKKKYNLQKSEEKSAFVKEVLKEISLLNSVSEQEIYLTEIKEITGIAVDILRRDMEKGTTKTAPLPQEINTNQTGQDATIKATEFVLASMLFEKDYANIKINLEQYIINPTLKKLYNLILESRLANKKLIASTLFDIFDMETDFPIKNVINQNFAIIEDEVKYFQTCIWQIIENELKFRKNNYSKQYKDEVDADKKRDLLKQIANIDLQLKNKNLGDF